MLETERSSGTLRVRSDDFEVLFRHQGDRWVHELSVRQTDRWQWILRSIEGAADTTVPPSPPLQDLRLEQLAEQVFEFQGMGQAGGAIYSAAIRVDAEHNEIVFDLCVRGKRGDSFLQPQSTYEIPDETTSSVPAGPAVVLTALNVRLNAVPLQIEGQPAAACRLTTLDGSRRIIANCSPTETYDSMPRPRTIRWGYRLQLGGLP